MLKPFPMDEDHILLKMVVSSYHIRASQCHLHHRHRVCAYTAYSTAEPVRYRTTNFFDSREFLPKVAKSANVFTASKWTCTCWASTTCTYNITRSIQTYVQDVLPQTLYTVPLCLTSIDYMCRALYSGKACEFMFL